MSMTPSQAKELGKLFGTARARSRKSVRDLGADLRVAYVWINRLERGDYLDPSPHRLARLAEVLDIDPARIDRIMRGGFSDSLPSMRTYFRAKTKLTPEQAAQVERYIERLRRAA